VKRDHSDKKLTLNTVVSGRLYSRLRCYVGCSKHSIVAILLAKPADL